MFNECGFKCLGAKRNMYSLESNKYVAEFTKITDETRALYQESNRRLQLVNQPMNVSLLNRKYKGLVFIIINNTRMLHGPDFKSLKINLSRLTNNLWLWNKRYKPKRENEFSILTVNSNTTLFCCNLIVTESVNHCEYSQFSLRAPLDLWARLFLLLLHSFKFIHNARKYLQWLATLPR